MKLKFWVICLLAAGLLFYLPGCKKVNLFDKADGTLTRHSDCKGVEKSGAANISGTFQTDQECIVYQYNGEDTLLVFHTNSVLNCCPVQILANIEFSPGLISISEREQEKGCKCLCFYDIDYQFINIPPGVYTVRITCTDGTVREYTFDLNTSLSGNLCWDASLYPPE